MGIKGRRLKKIEHILEDGKVLGEILNTVNIKSEVINILTSLQNSIVMHAMNQNIDIKILF